MPGVIKRWSIHLGGLAARPVSKNSTAAQCTQFCRLIGPVPPEDSVLESLKEEIQYGLHPIAALTCVASLRVHLGSSSFGGLGDLSLIFSAIFVAHTFHAPLLPSQVDLAPFGRNSSADFPRSPLSKSILVKQKIHSELAEEIREARVQGLVFLESRIFVCRIGGPGVEQRVSL